MRSKLVLAGLIFLSTLHVFAQVPPAAKIEGLPVGVGGGITDYDTDYYYPDLPYWSGRMLGASVWGDYYFWHGLGAEVNASSIFASAPTFFTPAGTHLYGNSLKQQTIQGGFIYRTHTMHHVRPFVRGMGGWGQVDFKTTDPYYTSETTPLWSVAGGLETRVWGTLNLRAEYEYQIWKGFRSNTPLNPNGFTIGATYYLRGPHRHY